MRVLLPIGTSGYSASRRRATSRVHLPAPQRAAPFMSARWARSSARINEPGMTAPTGIRASRSDELGFGLCHRHPPPRAFAVALIGFEIDLAERGIGRFPVRRQPFRLNRAFVAADRLRLEIVAIKRRRARILDIAAAVRNLTGGLSKGGIHREIEMVLVDPSQQPATRRLPLPDLHGQTGRRREVQSTLR